LSNKLIFHHFQSDIGHFFVVRKCSFMAWKSSITKSFELFSKTGIALWKYI